MRFSYEYHKLVCYILILAVLSVLVAYREASAAGGRLSFVLDAPGQRSQEARIIARQLAEAGIHARVKIWDKPKLRDIARKGHRQACLTDWGSSFFDPYDLAVPKLSTGGRGNFSFYSNPRVDELLDLGSSSTDPSRREKAYHEVQEIIFQQTPWAFGYTLPRFEASSFSVQSYIPSLDGRINLHDVRLTEGDSLVVVLATSSFLSLDPAAYRGRETETVIRNLFDALVTRTPHGKIVMELAESYEAPNPTTYIFTLRQGPRFHNGDPVTASDVAFTFQRVLSPYGLQGKASPRRGLLGPLERVEPVGPFKVRFVLQRPFPHLLQALAHFQIVPEKYLRKVGETAFAENPVGTGPFKFAGGTVHTGIVMERFDDYYGGSPDLPPVGPAAIARVTFRPVAEADDRIAALIGPAAVIAQDIPVDKVEVLRRESTVRILAVDGTRSYQLELNNALPPFNDIRLRKAVSLSIDWSAILARAYDGLGEPLATCFLPNGFGFDPGIKPPGRNLEAVRELLLDAGYDVTPVPPDDLPISDADRETPEKD